MISTSLRAMPATPAPLYFAGIGASGSCLEQGEAAGYERGKSAGFTQGLRQGEAAGFTQGETVGFERGEAAGRLAGRLEASGSARSRVFARRNLPLSPEMSERIDACTEPALLERWLEEATVASSVEEALRAPGGCVG
ncbi:MAG TPA: hypothetical protein VK459_06455 [Polyangiaceae bacterium]|nr:hypothetical protein [Polyangiaceae bacterium]